MDPITPQPPTPSAPPLSTGENLEVPAVPAGQPAMAPAQPNYSANATAGPYKRTQSDYVYAGIVGLFILLVLIEWFYPNGTPDCNSRGCPQVVTVTSLLAIPTLLFSLVAAVAVLIRCITALGTGGAVSKLLGGIVGVMAGGFILLVGLISSFVGQMNGQPPSS